MSIKSFIAICSAFVAAAALAQQPLGTVESVQGIVTVTTGTAGGTAVKGLPIADGMRFVAPSGGSAVLRFNNGCVINLQPNQAVTILRSMRCPELLAAVQNVGGGVQVANGSFATGAAATGGLMVGGIGLANALSHKSISGN